VVIGAGSLETALRAEAQRLGLEASVRFLGSQSQSVIAQYLHSCRAAVVPSIIDRRGETEGMPTVVLEAMAAGARVVASEVAGIPDVIGHGQNGWLARPADPGDLADKVLLALDDPSESPVIHAALATADDYAWPRVAERYMDVLRRLVSPAAALTSPAGAGA
jgi:glycosyltransferase involved in cell wall biosynthesis